MSTPTPSSIPSEGSPAHPLETERIRNFAGWLFPAASHIVVFTILGGVLYLGHHTGWKLPKLSELRGSQAAKVDDWCSEHLVPDSICVECKPELFPKPKETGFCRKHGVTECVICHPELAQVKGDVRGPSYDTTRALALIPRPENNSRNTLHKRRIQFASDENIAKAGIDIDVVDERHMADTISANGQVVFDPRRIAHLSPRAAGTVFKVFKTTGDSVTAGESLAIVDAALVGQTKAQLLQSVVQLKLKRSNLDRLKAAGDGVPAKALIEADAASQESEIAVLSARQSLVNLGFALPEELELLDAKTIAAKLQLLGIERSLFGSDTTIRSTNLIAIRAPIDGVIVSSDSVVGEVVDTSQILYTIADPKSLWLTLNVRQEDARYLQFEQSVEFQPDDRSDAVWGKVSWISPDVDERTRTVQVRVSLQGEKVSLRDKTFGTGRIILRDEPKAITVPREAVQSASDAKFVFVRDRNFFKEGSPKVFHVRQVRVGAEDEKSIELLAGVLPGEVVVTKGSATLLAQLLRSNLGAGCGCHDH